MNPEERYLKAKSLFEEGYNCAQGVLLAFSDITGIDSITSAKIASPFGGGMGKLRETCGAFSGMLIALGPIAGYDITTKDNKNNLYKTVQYLSERFKENCGSIICADLLGIDRNREYSSLDVHEKKSFIKRPCAEITGIAAFILAEYFNSYFENMDN